MSSRKCIGILGGGQLARMSAYQAYKLGFDVAILEKEKQSPAGQLTKYEYVGWVDDKEILDAFAERSDVITLENEFIDSGILKYLEEKGKTVVPSSSTVGLIQDKYIQKKTLNEHGLPVPRFAEVKREHKYADFIPAFGKKFILKSRKMGYDGYGNFLVTDEKSFNEGIKKLAGRHNQIMAEEFVKFEKELAVMVVRSRKEYIIYPVVETIQKNHICHTVLAPAELKKKVEETAREIAFRAVDAVNGIGIYGIELFLTANGEILVNEMAPRPHNSGHYTIEACVTSQFENHIRSVLDLPLGSAGMGKKSAVMINLLGKKSGEGVIEDYSKALLDPESHLHIYGKADSRPGRKMGHLTMIGKDMKELLKTARKIEKKIII